MRDGDGNVVINVTADDKEAQKRLDSLNRSILKLEQNIKSSEAARLPITEQLNEASLAAAETAARIEELKANIALSEESTGINGNLSPADWLEEIEAQKMLKAELAEQEKLLQQQEKDVAKLQAQDAKLLNTIQQQTQQLEQQKEEAGGLFRRLSEGVDDQKYSDAVKNVAGGFKSGLKSMLKWGIGIRSLYVLVNKLRQYIKEAVKSFAANDPETKAAFTELKANLSALQMTWGAAFAPIVTAALPLLNTLIDWLTRAANAVANFFAVLGGKPTYKKAVANAEKLAGYLDDAAGAAGAARKELMGIDELNVLSDSGGGGGGASSPGFDWVEDIANGETFSGAVALAIKDIFADWSDLTDEQIAAKVFAGADMLGGAILGTVIGGVPGLLIGGALGLALGIVKNAIGLNRDGKLSPGELKSRILTLLLPLLGAGAGLLIGPAGAVIGFTIGTIISLRLLYKTDDAEGGDVVSWLKEHLSGQAIKEWFVQWFWEDGIKKGWEESIKPLFQSTIDIGAEMFETGKNIVDNLLNGFSEKWEGFRKTLSDKWDNLKSWWKGLSLGKINIKLPHLSITQIPVDNAIARFLGIRSVPQLSVQWYAKGGIVDGATLIGAGEAGKEAIVPLERNTEWVRMVAKELASMLFDTSFVGGIGAKLIEVASAIDRLTLAMQQPLPAVAMGTVIPPNMVANTDVMDRLAELLSRLESGDSVVPIDITTKVYLDRREIGESVTRYQAERGRARG